MPALSSPGRPTSLIRRVPGVADENLTEYCAAVPDVLPHRPFDNPAEHRFPRAVDRDWATLRDCRRGDGLDHQTLILGAAPIQVWDTRRWVLGKLGRHTYVYPCHLLFQSRVISLLATAIAMGITASAPFNGVEDENLAIAYVSALILIFLVRFLSPKLAVFVELATGI